MIGRSSHAAPRYLSDLFRSGTPAALSDAELLNRFASRGGEHDEAAELAFAALLARHGPMVLRVCRAALGDRHEVEDAFQATFLVLAVRARSIRRRGSVASWLHGVALRVAGSARSRAARRRRHERARAEMTSLTTEETASDPVCDHERALALQEEIGRLPDKYRAVVVLCYLEGLTHEMAAERLGWPVGSVKSRLAWARDRLRTRLTGRGVAPAMLPLDRSGSSRDAEPAPTTVLIGTPLADATLRGALKAGIGEGAPVGIVSAEAVALMEGIITSMTNIRLMLATVAVLFAGLVTAGAAVMAHSATQPEHSPLAAEPGQEARRPAAGPGSATKPAPRAGIRPATDQGPLILQVDVADPEGHRLAGADVAVTVWYSRGSGEPESILLRTRTDGEGHARLEVARERPGARASTAYVWAHQPGHGIATSIVRLGGTGSPPVTPLTLGQPAKWTITVLGPDDRPMEGIRVAPYSVRRANGRIQWFTVPDEWADRLTATTDARGVAALTYLPHDLVPLTVRIAGDGFAPHLFPFESPQGKDLVVKLGRPGRLVGIVRSASGEPMAGVSVEVWVQGTGTVPGAVTRRRITPDAVVPLGPRPMKTGAQGAFQTPATLLGGSSYRVAIRQDGFAPFVSDWVKLDGQRATIPDIRLQPLRTVTGRIRDRQGRAVAGARVFSTAGGPATTTDAAGRFTMAGLHPGKAVILVEQAGFRLQGWPVDPSARAEVGPFTLVRTGEAPGPVMSPMADPIPPEESRALADRLLEPYLPAESEKGDDRARLEAISVLGEFDMARALELLQDHKFRDEDRLYQSTRASLAATLAETDPARAEAMAEAIPVPMTRADALAKVAGALPASERGRKLALLERATAVLREGLPQANRGRPLALVSTIAGQWLDMGERERARLLLEQGKSLVDSLRPAGVNIQLEFLTQLARLEPNQALERLRKLPRPDPATTFYDAAASTALGLATNHPAEAERAYNLWERIGINYESMTYAMRLCRRLARVDPQCARRVAAAQRGPSERALAWAYVALGLAETGKDRSGVSDAIDHVIQEIDRLRESGPGPEQVIIIGDVRLMYPTNPAAVILPVVERAAPDRLAEVFWRAVTLHPRLEPDREEQLHYSYIGFECLLLARYDRAVAAALFEPMDVYLRSLASRKSPQNGFNAISIAAKGCIDPRATVTLMESLTPPPEFARYNPVHDARLRLVELLGLPREQRWRRLWRSMALQIPLDD